MRLTTKSNSITSKNSLNSWFVLSSVWTPLPPVVVVVVILSASLTIIFTFPPPSSTLWLWNQWRYRLPLLLDGIQCLQGVQTTFVTPILRLTWAVKALPLVFTPVTLWFYRHLRQQIYSYACTQLESTPFRSDEQRRIRNIRMINHRSLLNLHLLSQKKKRSSQSLKTKRQT